MASAHASVALDGTAAVLIPQVHAAARDAARPRSPAAARSATRARTMAGGRPWTSMPSAPS
eukprot:4151936-Alexandrium_andersonii.AAC.1